eukprot:CAMPEP_0184708084 /NCGR_PEP_ID=MMETSP0313-20130426/37594_1 /TAXON_ID=2792 /ORGANISM="Porphyridium aerugineum, Strain SAG 1380-2" /LENGTH=966 /DNA_ID=CAMNT_0027169665 /DNA_START=52 /DNA_END=2952 /DNA_ORIENTATION=+
MGSLFRSEEMIQLRLFLDRSAALSTIHKLGHLGLFEFLDLNPSQSPFQRTYASDVRMCDEMVRKIKFLKSQLNKASDQGQIIPVQEIKARHKSSRSASASASTSFSASIQDPEIYEEEEEEEEQNEKSLNDLDAILDSYEQRIIETNRNYDALHTHLLRHLEHKLVLEKVAEVFLQESRNQLGMESRDMVRRNLKMGSVRARIGQIMDPILHQMPLFPISDEYDGQGASLSLALSTQGGSSNAKPKDKDVEDIVSSQEGDSSYKQSGLTKVLSFSAGCLETSNMTAFERLIFRASRGNIFARFSMDSSALVDPVTKEKVNKTVFVVFYAGEQVKAKIVKICKSLNANLYHVSQDRAELEEELEVVENEVREAEHVLINTESQRNSILFEIGKDMDAWIKLVLRKKAIFHTLNLLNSDASGTLLVAEGWCPKYAFPRIEHAIRRGYEKSKAQIQSVIEHRQYGHETPPTYFQLNKFTEVFHNIVEAYGVAEYQEVNPAPFLVITFPFLFAVMFGDIGHGILMALFALALIIMERRLQGSKSLGEMGSMLFNGRYIIFLMGLFSIYTGFIYNEIFAIPVDIFGTRWQYTAASEMACGIDNCANPAAVLPPLRPYPFGFDPIWKPSQTGLLFFNSYKMKLSIVLGVSQMTLGLLMSAENARFFRNPVNFFFEFVPQIIFLLSLFGYLVFLIIFKWLFNWNSAECTSNPTCAPPDLKAILIGMIMSPGNVPENLRMFPGQSILQVVLLGLSMIAVPWMLLPKPLILRAQNLRKKGYKALQVRETSKSMGVDIHKGVMDATENGSSFEDRNGKESPAALDTHDHDYDHNHGQEDDNDDDSGHDGHGKFEFGEVMVHQMIHTIEFVLGAVSNTASYLRLWALSLAHAQLGDVFLEKLLLGPIEAKSIIGSIIGCIAWLGATLVVLMSMESLSAFLHALRLHWVEFQNKFYNLHGAGRAFVPFAFSKLSLDVE